MSSAWLSAAALGRSAAATTDSVGVCALSAPKAKMPGLPVVIGTLPSKSWTLGSGPTVACAAGWAVTTAASEVISAAVTATAVERRRRRRGRVERDGSNGPGIVDLSDETDNLGDSS